MKRRKKLSRHRDPRHGVAKHVATRRTEKLPVVRGQREKPKPAPVERWAAELERVLK